MSYNILKNPPTSGISTIDSWDTSLKEQHLEVSHDQSMLTLANPDDALIVVGPPRLKLAKGETAEFHIVGMVQSLQYSEQSQLQPMKAIGSKRHVFSRTNGPVQGSIGRALFLGQNLYKALYALTDGTDLLADAQVSGTKGDASSNWYANLEEDLFRVPLGLGIIYRSAGSNAASKNIGADYLEVVSLQSRNVSLQSGQAMIMEQVQFMADRIIPWTSYSPELARDVSNPAGGLF